MSRVTLLSILISILTLISGSPVINNDVNQNSKNVYPSVEVGEKAIEHKTTSLLTEALQMIHKSKDFKERKWLESFVQRLAKLASELEENSKQEIQSKNKVKDEDKAARLQNENEVLVSGKEEMPVIKRPGTTEVVYSEAPINARFNKEQDTFNPPQLKVPETTPEADMLSQRVPLETTLLVTDQPNLTTQSESLHRVPLQQQILEKNELLREIFYKTQRLKELGGSQQDVINLLKRFDETLDSQNPLNDQEDIEFEEEGAAAGELEADMSDVSTLAPSLGNVISTSKKPDEDDLVKQLEGEKFLLVNPNEPGKEEVLRRINGLVAPSVV